MYGFTFEVTEISPGACFHLSFCSFFSFQVMIDHYTLADQFFF
jgi:hypothetical protein